MDTRVAREMINVIRTEQSRRTSQWADEDPNLAYDQWLFVDAPFVSEMCLMILVALRHQVERQLVRLAARATEDGGDIGRQEYLDNVRRTRESLKNRGWGAIHTRLQLGSCVGQDAMEVLRLLANSYKHHPSVEPDEELLKKLKLELGVNYAPVPESGAVQEGLAAFIGLGSNADYCDIAERFLGIADDFLSDVQRRTKLSRVKGGKVSFSPSDAAR